MVKATAASLHRVFLALKPFLPSPCVSDTNTNGEGNGRCLHRVTMVKATAACLHRVFLAPKPLQGQRPFAVTVCFWHQTNGEGNGRLPSPCALGTKTLVKATAASFTVCFWH